VDDDDVALRNFTYGLFLHLGRAPIIDEVSQATGWAVESVRAGWQRLHDEHALVLQTGTSEIPRASP
jgi:hypothetical protein